MLYHSYMDEQKFLCAFLIPFASLHLVCSLHLFRTKISLLWKELSELSRLYNLFIEN